jgi:ABC-2 type transport system ATP-binding protein
VSNTIISVQNLKKSYGKKIAVDGISFSVAKGEIFGLLGPNGAGKTTTLEILEGLKNPDDGKIQILGREAIGVVLQSGGFFPDLNLRELLQLFSSFYHKSAPLARLIERFDLGSILYHKFSHLSGGQRQRFVLATALVHQPELLILDEPTLGLDPGVRQKFWETILSLQEDGLTILLTTHYMEEAEILCDRVAIIDQGRISAIERPVKLINSLGIVSRIKFMSSKLINLAELEELPGILAARRDRYTYDLETETPEISLRELLAWEKRFSGKIFNLQVRQATLDDVFLKLTGHSLRE